MTTEQSKGYTISMPHGCCTHFRVMSPENDFVCAAFTLLAAQLIVTALNKVSHLPYNAVLLDELPAADWEYINSEEAEALNEKESEG